MEINYINSELQLAKSGTDFFNVWMKYKDFFEKNNGKIIFTQESFVESPLPSVEMFNGYEENFKSLFLNNKFMFLDKRIVSEMLENEKSDIAIDYSVSFDTQFSSFIERYFTNKRFSLEQDFETVLYKLMDNNVNSDYGPYILENLSKSIDIDGVVSNIEHIVKFFNLDSSSSILLKNMKIKDSTLYQNELSRVKDSIYSSTFKDIYDDFSDMQKIMYAILMKIILINQSKKSIKYKMNQLIEFMHTELHTLYLRELIVAEKFYKSLNNGNEKIIFFNKVVNINNKTLERLKNMAWDFSLIRHIESLFKANPKIKSDFYISYFLTFDKGLSQIMDLYPLKAIVYFESIQNLRIIPNINISELANEYNLNSYFSEEALKVREKKRKNRSDYHHLIDGLEEEIKSFI